MARMPEIPAEILAEMTPAVRAFVESLLFQMAAMQSGKGAGPLLRWIRVSRTSSRANR